MDRGGAEETERVAVRSRTPVGWWALLLGVLTAAGLAALSGSLLVLHALGYGMATLMAPDAGATAPDPGRHAAAFAVGVIAQVATASALLLLAPRTAVRTWPPVAQALATSLVAAAAAACVLLLALGINPVAFVLGR